MSALGCAAQTTASVTTSWGVIAEPSLPTLVCKTLLATQTPVNGSLDAVDANPANSAPDTAQIQQALDNCPAGQAVHLVKGGAGQSGFLMGPINLKSGVTLWIDSGVTLFASRNPADYDNGVGACGTATANSTPSCNALIRLDHVTHSGIVGGGVIDGRGGSLLTSGPNAGRRSWWDVAYQTKTSNVNQQNPRLLNANGGGSFVLYGVAFENAPNFHIALDAMDGVIAWGIKILSPSLVYSKPGYACPKGTTPDQVTPATCFTPDTVKNTDGFDPGESSHVLLAYSYVSDGDDHVAVKAGSGAGSHDLMFAHNHLYYGHGLSIGSETNTGVSNVAVEDLSVDGYDSPNGVGIRIKSDASRGGVVSAVSYQDICMRNVHEPMAFDAFYSAAKGKSYPWFKGITINGFHDTGSVSYGGGELVFAAYAKYPLQISMQNVQFDGEQPTLAMKGHNGSPSQLPANTDFSFGPTPVSFAGNLETKQGTGDVVTNSVNASSSPVDCSDAFVPMSSVLSDSPI
ncbi:glycoside hydrolase family 28 protein [Dyella caseinilytica]|uniref:Glycoside hydrolase family 28 protein n=2 Tax=Dyella caseinilytica TaxID=1849581 RepID=A0ABX7GZV4_9GAMM|nr:glycoside hydrolase family 28 protein [Dyella caseinilytica]GGA03198.1 polygalacturonase [Dyella caseinilytica]